MKPRAWKRGARLAFALAGFGFCALPHAARAQAPTQAAPAVDVETRLRKLEELNEKLEKQNQKLAEQNEKLEKQNQGLQSVAPAAVEAGPGDALPVVKPDEVKKLVDGYLKEKDSTKKAAEEAAKAAKEAEGYEVGSDLNLKTTWRDGFNAETPNKDFRIHIGAKEQNDFGWFAPDANLRNAFPTGTPGAPGPGPNAWNDGADLRRARLRIDGTAWEVVDFVFEYEFAQTQQVSSSGATLATVSATGPTDMYADIKDIPYAGRVRVGHFKEPFSLEDYGTSDVYLTFLERSTANDAFSPNRNYGVMVWNDPFEQRMVYGVGAFKENTNTNIGNAFDYGTSAYAATGRIGFNPWYENDGRCVFYFGGAYSFRHFDDSSALDRYRYASRIPIRVGSPILLDTTSLTASSAQLFNAQAALVCGPFSMQGEYYVSQGEGVARGLTAVGVPRELNPELNGGYVQATLFLTGEHRTYVRETGGFGRIRPLEPFYFVPRGGAGSGLGSCFGKGAWELAARFDYLDLNSPAFGTIPAVRGVSGSGAAAIATVGIERDLLFGVNWYLNSNVKMQWNYTHAVRDVAVPTASGSVDAFAMRLTLDF
jgi:phosphate-selective porin OprO and OprP